MNGSSGADLLTVGHSNLPADRFLALIKAHRITTVVDVRSVPFSRRFPWFSGKVLAERLNSQRIGYLAMGELLGGRPANPVLYRDGVADYEAMAETDEFRAGLDRVTSVSRSQRLCLMCAEREPLDCHRCLLVARAAAERGYLVGHLLGDGQVESHAATEQRLLDMTAPADLFGSDSGARLATAYRQRSRQIAVRLADRVRPGRVPRSFMSS